MGILAYFSKSYYNKPKTELSFLLLGPENSGKTTCLLNLAYPGARIVAIPTVDFNADTMRYRKYSINLLDMTRSEWVKQSEKEQTDLIKEKDAMLFFVDCTRISEDKYQKEIKKLFFSFLNLEASQTFPFVIVVNKRDLVSHAVTEEVTKILDLNMIKDRKWYITAASAKNSDGLVQCLDLLINSLEISNKEI